MTPSHKAKRLELLIKKAEHVSRAIQHFGDGTCQRYEEVLYSIAALGFQPVLNENGKTIEINGHHVFKDAHETRLYYDPKRKIYQNRNGVKL